MHKLQCRWRLALLTPRVISRSSGTGWCTPCLLLWRQMFEANEGRKDQAVAKLHNVLRCHQRRACDIFYRAVCVFHEQRGHRSLCNAAAGGLREHCANQVATLCQGPPSELHASVTATLDTAARLAAYPRPSDALLCLVFDCHGVWVVLQQAWMLVAKTWLHVA